MQPVLAATVVVLGAHGTGAPVLAAALQTRWDPAGITVWACEDPDGCESDLGPALQSARAADLTLLMGLDLPCPADRRAAQEAADARLRAVLAAAGTGFRVVYGSTDGVRLAHAELALRSAIKTGAGNHDCTRATGLFGLNNLSTDERPARLRAWNCEKCSDPECEHRLFTALADGRRDHGPG